MPVLVHSSRFEHEAISPHRPAEQFKISNALALLVGFLVMGTVGVLWLVMDLGFLLMALSDAWWGDFTLQQRYGLALLAFIFLALHSFGGVVFVAAATGADFDDVSAACRECGEVSI